MKKLFIVLAVLTLLLAMSGLALAADYELDELTVNGDEVDLDVDDEELSADIGKLPVEFEIIAETSGDDAVIDMELLSGYAGELSEVEDGKATLDLPKNAMFALLEITISDATEEKSTYILTLLRVNSDAELGALLQYLQVNTDDSKASKGKKLLENADFDPGVTEYKININEDDELEEVYLWLEALGDVDVEVDGDKLRPKDYDGYAIELDYGDDEQEVEIEVINADDDDITTTYTLTFVFDEETESNESLDDLLVSEKDSDSSKNLYSVYPEFDSAILTYYAFLPDGDDDAYVLLEVADKDYYVVEGTDDIVKKTGDYVSKQLTDIDDGDSYDFKVYDEDDDLLDTYTVIFHLGDDKDDDETELDSLELRNKTGVNSYDKVSFDQSFDPAKAEYTVNVASNTYNKVRIYAEAEDSGAHVLVNGQMTNKDDYVEVEVAKGKNTITVTVIAENCDDSEEYTITVNYGTVVSDTTLSSLYVRTSIGTTLNLSPAFAPSTKVYTGNVANNVAAISLNPTPAAAGARILFGSTELIGGAYSNYFQLGEGINNVTLTVSGEGAAAASSVYYLAIYRQPASVKAVVSSQALTLNGAEKSLYAYNINGNNFVKLRDLASLMNGTAKQFSVEYDNALNAIKMVANSPYVSNGQENVKLSTPRKVEASSQIVYKNGIAVTPMAYNIDGNNFVMLRDIGLLFDFNVSFDNATKTIRIDTAAPYNPAN